MAYDDTYGTSFPTRRCDRNGSDCGNGAFCVTDTGRRDNHNDAGSNDDDRYDNNSRTDNDHPDHICCTDDGIVDDDRRLDCDIGVDDVGRLVINQQLLVAVERSVFDSYSFHAGIRHHVATVSSGVSHRRVRLGCRRR